MKPAIVMNVLCGLAMLLPACAKGIGVIADLGSTTWLVMIAGVFEVILGIFFLTGRWVVFATYGMAVLASCFMCWHLVQGGTRSCGCLGPVELRSAQSLMLASAYLGLAGIRGWLLSRIEEPLRSQA